MRTNNLVWGVLLVGLGSLLLMETMGLLPRGVNVWGIFWPLALIALGVSWVLGASRRDTTGERLAIPLEAAGRARVRLHHAAGELRVDGEAAPGQLLDGVFGGGAASSVSHDGAETRVDLRVPTGAFPFPVGTSQGFQWQVHLTREVELALEVEGGASRMFLDLRGLRVRNLRLETGASSTEIDFPASAGETSARIECGAASVEMRVPEGVAARIRVNGGLGSANIDTLRFPRTAGGFESPGYATAQNRLDIEISYGAGSVSVR